MNRRGFLKALGIVGGAALAAAKLPAALFAADEPTTLFDGPVTFSGIPFVYDQYCLKNTIYFLNPKTLWINRGDGWERPLLH